MRFLKKIKASRYFFVGIYVIMMSQEKGFKGQWSALGFAWELGYLIAIPLIVGALSGRFADGFFGTKPWLFLLGVGVSIVTTVVLVFQKTKAVLKDIERGNSEKQG